MIDYSSYGKYFVDKTSVSVLESACKTPQTETEVPPELPA